MRKRELDTIKRIFIHCSASPHFLHGRMVDADMIRGWHLDPHKPGGPFDDIGYHAVIVYDGEIQQGRGEEFIGAGAKGHNTDSLHVCMVGHDTFTMAQVRSLKDLCKMWMTKYHIDINQIFGHYQVNSGKTCPNFKIEEFKRLFL